MRGNKTPSTRFIALPVCVLQGVLHLNDTLVPQPHLLHLSSESLSRDGAFLMDCGSVSSPSYNTQLKLLKGF